MEVAYDAKRQVKPPERMKILEEIFKLRRFEEKVERQEMGTFRIPTLSSVVALIELHSSLLKVKPCPNRCTDSTATVFLENFDQGAKNDKDSDAFSDSDPHGDQEDQEDMEEGLLTPLSSAEASGSLTTPVDPPRTSQQFRSVVMAGERTPMFQMAPTLGFEDQSRQSHTFHSPQPSSKAEYSDSFSSQPLIRTPTAATVISPTSHRSFDFVAQQPFVSSEEQMRPLSQPTIHPQPSPQFDGWSSPYQQNMFNPIDYSGAASRTIHQQVSYPPFTIYPTTPSHDVHGAHSLPELHGARSQHPLDVMTLNPPFRTGSLSHPHMVSRHDATAGPSLV
jgi:hypothetical protein